jgi:uncharacterized Zn finger protein (UPF0148 family)
MNLFDKHGHRMCDIKDTKADIDTKEAIEAEANLKEAIEDSQPPLDDSILYLSSNWSTGGGGCIRYCQMFKDLQDDEGYL